MYTNHTMMFELAQAKQRDLLAQAETHRRAQQARQMAGASRQSVGRRSRHVWQLVLLRRAQAQPQS